MTVGNRWDVLILGGGVAGAAAALALARRGISRVCIVEHGLHTTQRLGESIPPDTRVLLHELGVLEEFLAAGHEACLGSCSSWGNERLGYNDFLLNPYGNGWHLDRHKFDRFLLEKAVESGAAVSEGTRFVDGERAGDDGFRLQLVGVDGKDHAALARFVVDATGLRSAFARRVGASPRVLDRITLVYGFFETADSSSISKLTMLEAVEDGWWYAARLSNHRLAVAFATDPEHIRRNALRSPNNWLARLQQTLHIAPRLRGCRLVSDNLIARPAPSFLLDRVAGERWLAVGDAASAYDPLSSQGIHKALADGLRAADVVEAWLTSRIDQAADYHSSTTAQFADYVTNRNYFYDLETRWPASPFWLRRQSRRSLDGESGHAYD
ncbi:MAG: FAD-dependent monooxygenase [Isosphaeraceae bacterium]|nr:FAD-dependent monooxygenase [Isosphaeraceae bacterium]